MMAVPVFHGSFGIWDEVLSLAGAVIILILIIALAFQGDKNIQKKK